MFWRKSVFDKLFEKNILVINLGISYTTGLTAFLHLEKKANVFYRHDKLFKGKTIDYKGQKILDSAIHFIKREKIFKNLEVTEKKLVRFLKGKKYQNL